MTTNVARLTSQRARLKATICCLYPLLFVGMGLLQLVHALEIRLPFPGLSVALIGLGLLGYWCRWSRRERPQQWRWWQMGAVGSLWSLCAICLFQGLIATSWLVAWSSIDVVVEAFRDIRYRIELPYV